MFSYSQLQLQLQLLYLYFVIKLKLINSALMTIVKVFMMLCNLWIKRVVIQSTLAGDDLSHIGRSRTHQDARFQPYTNSKESEHPPCVKTAPLRSQAVAKVVSDICGDNQAAAEGSIGASKHG